MKEKNILSHGLKDFSPKMVDAFALALTVVKEGICPGESEREHSSLQGFASSDLKNPHPVPPTISSAPC